MHSSCTIYALSRHHPCTVDTPRREELGMGRNQGLSHKGGIEFIGLAPYYKVSKEWRIHTSGIYKKKAGQVARFDDFTKRNHIKQ